MSTTIMFITECAVSMLVFAPGSGTLRRAAFAGQLGLQLIIGLTGSFSFFQPLTAVLAIPLLAADSHVGGLPAGSSAVALPALAAVSEKASVWAGALRDAVASAPAVTTSWASFEKAVGIAIVIGGGILFRVPFFKPIFALGHVTTYTTVMTGAAIVHTFQRVIVQFPFEFLQF